MAYSCRHSFQIFPSSPAGNCLLMLWRAALSLSIHQLHWLWRKDYKDMVIQQWRHNEHDGVSNHQPHDCLFKRLFRHRSKTTSKLLITGLCEGIHRWPVKSPHKGPVTQKMFPFDDVIMQINHIALDSLWCRRVTICSKGDCTFPHNIFKAWGNRHVIYCQNIRKWYIIHFLCVMQIDI